MSIQRAALSVLILPVLAVAVLRPAAAEPSMRVLEPASTGGVAELDRALARLTTHRRMLIIAAHPDDEDNRLLALVARGQGGEAAYFSLSRGEGGQNLIGEELGVGLGILRSRELLAARHVDGGRQFFSRAYDFGYTRSLAETFARWPRDELLVDAVRAVRRFKPQVVVAIFPPDRRAGHGQHQASAVIAREAFDRAGDAGAFPELRAEGLLPWSPQAFYRAAWWDPDAAGVTLPLGGIDPASGRSIFQLAMASRSQHRSQDMGLLQPLGDAAASLLWEAGAGAEGDDLWSGIDVRLEAIAAPLAPGPLARATRDRLARVAELAGDARAQLAPAAAARATAALLEIVTLLRQTEDELAAAAGGGDEAAAAVATLVAEKLDVAQRALLAAAGVAVDAWVERQTVVPGERLEARAVLWNAGESDVGELSLAVAGNAGFRLLAEQPAEPPRGRFATRVTVDRRLELELPAGAEPSVPYFLRAPLAGDLYDWHDAAPAERGAPFEAPPLVLAFRFTAGGVPIAVEREVVYRHGDQARGEVRRPLRVVPALEVAVTPPLVVWRIGETTTAPLAVEVRSNLDRPQRARLEVEVPDGWPAIPPREVAIDEPQGEQAVTLTVTAPPDLAAGRYPIAVAVAGEDGRRYAQAFELIDYEHVRPTPLPVPARVDVAAGTIHLPALGRVGYLRGASDRVPESLRAIGVPLELLDAAALLTGDLTSYDAIVVGSRAYETEPALARANGRLLDYVRGGGLLIVQYQQYAFVRGGFAPYPLDINRPHDRATDETEPVRLLRPEHPVFHHPNEIRAEDWDGWVQERGLYFAGTWDEAYAPLLAMADPEGVERQGALLVAPLGRGTYVYTGLAFFRQLPAGVVGAYRLFANLLALGEDDDGK